MSKWILSQLCKIGIALCSWALFVDILDIKCPSIPIAMLPWHIHIAVLHRSGQCTFDKK